MMISVKQLRTKVLTGCVALANSWSLEYARVVDEHIVTPVSPSTRTYD